MLDPLWQSGHFPYNWCNFPRAQYHFKAIFSGQMSKERIHYANAVSLMVLRMYKVHPEARLWHPSETIQSAPELWTWGVACMTHGSDSPDFDIVWEKPSVNSLCGMRHKSPSFEACLLEEPGQSTTVIQMETDKDRGPLVLWVVEASTPLSSCSMDKCAKHMRALSENQEEACQVSSTTWV